MRRLLAAVVIILLLAGGTAGAPAPDGGGGAGARDSAAPGGAGGPGEISGGAAGGRDEATPDGLLWSNITRLTDGPELDLHPRLAVSADGTTAVAWDRNGQYMWVRTDSHGNRLINETLVPGATFPVQYSGFVPHCIAVDSRGCYHLGFKDGDYGVYYAKMDGKGNQLVPKMSVPSGASAPHAPSIAVSRNDIVHVLYEDCRFSYDYEAATYARILNNGTIDKDGVRTSPADQRVSGTTICTDYANNVHAVYVNASMDVYHTKLDNFGNPLPQAPPTLLYKAAGAYEEVGPAAVCADGTGGVHIVWNTNASGVGRLMYMKLDNNGKKLAAGPFDEGIALTEEPTAKGYPSIAADKHGTVYAVWSDNRNGALQIFYIALEAEYLNSPTLPDRAVFLTEGLGGNALEPDIAVDDGADVHVVWREFVNGSIDLFYRFANHAGVKAGMAAEESYNLLYIHPNETRTGNLTVRNTGGLNDTAYLDLTSNLHGHKSWNASIEMTELVLEPNQTRKIRVSVTAAPEGLNNDYIDVSVVARSGRCPTINSTIKFRTYLVVNRAISLECSDREKETVPGVEAGYQLSLKNRGEFTEEIWLWAVGPGGWGWEVRPALVTLGPGLCCTVTLAVVPANDTGGQSGVVKVTAQTTINPGVKSWVSVTTRVRVELSIVLEPDRSNATVLPGGAVGFTITVRQSGNAWGSWIVALWETHDGPGWEVWLDTPVVELRAEGDGFAVLYVNAPADAPGGSTLEVAVCAALEDGSIRCNASCNVSVTVGAVSVLEVSVQPEWVMAIPGGRANFGVGMFNAGNGPERLRLGRALPPPGWDLSFRFVEGQPLPENWSAELEGGQTFEVIAVLAVPALALAGEYFGAGELLDGSGRAYPFGLTVVVTPLFGAQLGTDGQPLQGEPGGILRFPLGLRNPGNGNDTYILEATDRPDGWEHPTFIDPAGILVNRLALGPGSEACLTALVHIPERPALTEVALAVRAVSAGGPASGTTLFVRVVLSDLVITGVRLSTEKPVKDQLVVVNVTVENRGQATARNVTLELHRNGEAIIPRAFGTLEPGRSRVESFVWIPRAGRNELRFVVDPQNLVCESNETANTAVVTQQIADGAVSRPVDYSWSAVAVAAGAAVTVVLVGIVFMRRKGGRKPGL